MANKKIVKFYKAAQDTLSKKDIVAIEKKLENAISKSKIYKRAEVSTIGDIYFDPKWKGKRLIPITTMHVARLLKR